VTLAAGETLRSSAVGFRQMTLMMVMRIGTAEFRPRRLAGYDSPVNEDRLAGCA